MPLRQQALQAHQAGQLTRAETLYREVLVENAEDIDVLHMLGVVVFQRMRYREALEMLWQAAEKTGWELPQIRHSLGLVLAKLHALAASRVHVHYHWMFDPDKCEMALEFLEQLNVPRERLAWLARRVPLLSKSYSGLQ